MKRYLTPTKEQLFEEFKKAIPDLTIDNSERLRIRNRKLEEEKSELKEKTEKLQEALRKVDELWADKERMEHNRKN